MYAYHATLKKNQKSIEENGLVLNQSKYNDNNYYVENQLFFTWLSAEEANDVVSFMIDDSLDDHPELENEEIIVYAIDIHDFDIDHIKYDYNYNCDSYDEIKTFAYTAPIPPEKLILIDPKEISGDKWYCDKEDLLKSDDEFVQKIVEKLEVIFEEVSSYFHEKD